MVFHHAMKTPKNTLFHLICILCLHGAKSLKMNLSYAGFSYPNVCKALDCTRNTTRLMRKRLARSTGLFQVSTGAITAVITTATSFDKLNCIITRLVLFMGSPPAAHRNNEDCACSKSIDVCLY